MDNYTGFRAKSPYRMVLDAGQFIVGLNEESLRATGIAAALTDTWTWEGKTITPTLLGATRGGATFDPQKEERQIEVNGLRVPVMGLDRVDKYMPTLSVTLLEMADVTTLKLAIGQASSEVTDSGFTEVTPKIDVTVDDYIPNVALLTRSSEDGQAKPVIWLIRNAKIVDNATFNFEDPGEVATEVSFRGAASASAPGLVPCAIYVPVPDDGLDGSGS